MKKQHFFIAILVIFTITICAWLPCQADDNVLYGCAQKKKGNLRLVSDPSQCKKSEYPVTFSGTSQQNQNPLPNFEGELCWSIHATENKYGTKDSTALMKSWIKYIGNQNYLIQGFMQSSGQNTPILSGEAIVIEGDIYMNATNTHDGSPEQWRCAGNFQGKLSSSTLNGTFWDVGNCFEYDTVRTVNPDYTAGTLTLTACP